MSTRAPILFRLGWVLPLLIVFSDQPVRCVTLPGSWAQDTAEPPTPLLPSSAWETALGEEGSDTDEDGDPPFSRVALFIDTPLTGYNGQPAHAAAMALGKAHGAPDPKQRAARAPPYPREI